MLRRGPGCGIAELSAESRAQRGRRRTTRPARRAAQQDFVARRAANECSHGWRSRYAGAGLRTSKTWAAAKCSAGVLRLLWYWLSNRWNGRFSSFCGTGFQPVFIACNGMGAGTTLPSCRLATSQCRCNERDGATHRCSTSSTRPARSRASSAALIAEPVCAAARSPAGAALAAGRMAAAAEHDHVVRWCISPSVEWLDRPDEVLDTPLPDRTAALPRRSGALLLACVPLCRRARLQRRGPACRRCSASRAARNAVCEFVTRLNP